MKNAIRRRPAVQPLPELFRHLGVAPHLLRHGRQLRSGHRHAEEADRQCVEGLRVAQAGDRSAGEKARQDLVHVRADLHHAAAQERRHKVFYHRAHVRAPVVERELQPAQEPEHGGELYQDLERAPGD